MPTVVISRTTNEQVASAQFGGNGSPARFVVR
jgi:hypothetical protein